MGAAGLTVAWALFGDRARGRLRCPKCWYDMQGASGDQCPECGFSAKSEKQWGRTRRRRKIGALAILICLLVGVWPFWRGLLRQSVGGLPSTVLIVLLNRVEEPLIADELRIRVTESESGDLYRWNREALRRWQWELLADRYPKSAATVYASLADAARSFSKSENLVESVIRPEEILAVERDSTGSAFRRLRHRLQLPIGLIATDFWSSLTVKSIDIHDVSGVEVKVFLVCGVQSYEVWALRRDGEQWRFAGHFNVRSKYADPTLRVHPEDPTIFEIGNLSTGGTGIWVGSTAWCRVDEDGLQTVHHWGARGHEYYSRSPFNCTFSVLSTEFGRDDIGRYVRHTLLKTFSNDGITWGEAPLVDEPDIALVADLGMVFSRTGVACYRWDAQERRFIHSAQESDWTAMQMEFLLSTYHEIFIQQNFEELVELARSEDPAKRAWVRLVLTRLEDSADKERLVASVGEPG